jgi:hypothetical protein
MPVPNPNQRIPTGGNGVVRSIPPTGRRDTPGPMRIIAMGNGMMTIDMDLRTAPPRRSAGSAVLDRPRDDPFRGSRPYATPRRSPAPRRLGVGVLAGALTMFVVALLDTVTGAQVPVLGSFAALPAPTGQQEIVEVAPPPATPGTCLTWGRPDASDTTVVDCGKTHLFEQAGTVQLADQKELPDDGRWRQLVRERCDPVVRDYLGGRFDPDGRYRVGALKPSPAKWEQGDRELRCGLQSASRSGALYPMAGTARDQDQSAVHEPGTCLGIDGRTIGDPVDCGGAHAVEAVGVVDLGGKFDDDFPAVDDQDEFLQTECTKIATTYSGGDDVITDKKLTVYWDNLTEDSWKAGTRRVNCNLAALLPDRSGFAPVTGSVRGQVSVGDTPAPPQTNTPEPGVPAEVPPVTPVPSAPSSPATSADKPDEGTETGSPSSDAPPQDGSTPKPDAPAAPSDGDAPKDQPVPSVPVLPPASVTPPDLSSLVGGGGY